ncbi:MAG: tripartite tricarboxylate transporter substrate-binding protein [Burkholderiales bacterium]
MKRLWASLAFGALVALTGARAHAQGGNGAVRILLGFADEAGFSYAQLLSDNIAAAMGQPVVIERKPGATGRIAAEALKNAPPDGTTLYLAPTVVPVLAPLVFRNLSYDPVKDFAPVAQVLTFRYALAVGRDHPAKTGREFIAWAKAHPKEASYGTAGAGSGPHFFGLMINQANGTQLLHVPYKGGAPMLADLMGGQIAAGIESITNMIELHRTGRIRILAISGAERSPLAPSIPTFREQGLIANDVVGWVGVFAPARTPKPVIDRLSEAIVEAVRTPRIRDQYWALGVEPTGTNAEELAAIMVADTARWAPIIKASGFSAD